MYKVKGVTSGKYPTEDYNIFCTSLQALEQFNIFEAFLWHSLGFRVSNLTVFIEHCLF